MPGRTITLMLNQQQLELLDRTIAKGAAADRVALIKRAIREQAERHLGGGQMRKIVSKLLLEPGTGKAIELLAGQILRIEQVEGGQCVDFNAFNLHDYKEFMHCGRTRTVHGFNPTKGNFLWSQPPRERALLYILADTYGRNDVLFPRCSSYLYESAYGFDAHTNCHDIQAEAQREYGLTPDDVHDSFNFFMNTEVTLEGRANITRQTSKAGDYIDLLALSDVLAVPNVCGADVMRTSNFGLKPIKLTVFEATEADLTSVPATPILKSQRTPKDFRQPTIKADRELRRDTAYRPEFTNVPIIRQPIAVTLTEQEAAQFAALRLPQYGDDDEAALRDLLFTWWEESFLTGASGAPAIGD